MSYEDVLNRYQTAPGGPAGDTVTSTPPTQPATSGQPWFGFDAQRAREVYRDPGQIADVFAEGGKKVAGSFVDFWNTALRDPFRRSMFGDKMIEHLEEQPRPPYMPYQKTPLYPEGIPLGEASPQEQEYARLGPAARVGALAQQEIPRFYHGIGSFLTDLPEMMLTPERQGQTYGEAATELGKGALRLPLDAYFSALQAVDKFGQDYEDPGYFDVAGGRGEETGPVAEWIKRQYGVESLEEAKRMAVAGVSQQPETMRFGAHIGRSMINVPRTVGQFAHKKLGEPMRRPPRTELDDVLDVLPEEGKVLGEPRRNIIRDRLEAEKETATQRAYAHATGIEPVRRGRVMMRDDYQGVFPKERDFYADIYNRQSPQGAAGLRTQLGQQEQFGRTLSQDEMFAEIERNKSHTEAGLVDVQKAIDQAKETGPQAKVISVNEALGGSLGSLGTYFWLKSQGVEDEQIAGIMAAMAGGPAGPKGMYSKLRRAVEKFPQRVQPSAVPKLLQKAGVSSKEIKFTFEGDAAETIGYMETDVKGNVSRETLLEYIDREGVRVKEQSQRAKTKAEEQRDSALTDRRLELSDEATALREKMDAVSEGLVPSSLQYAEKLYGEQYGQLSTKQKADLRKLRDRDIDATLTQTGPKAKEYHRLRRQREEIKRQIMEVQRTQKDLRVPSAKYEGYQAVEGGTNYTENVYKWERDLRDVAASERGPTGHFDVEGSKRDIFAHSRTSDFGDMRVLQEIQSDWELMGKQKGFRGSPDPYSVETIRRTAREIDGLMDNLRESRAVERPLDRLADWRARERYMVEQIRGSLDQIEPLRKRKGTIPDYPFRGNAHINFTLSRELLRAAQEGKKRFAWTTGEQQAKLYDLRKRVGKIRYSNEHSILTVADKQGKTILEQKASLDELSQWVGEKIAGDIHEQISRGVTSAQVQGAGLEIGGEGKLRLYNEIIPRFFQKLAKKRGWDIKIRKTSTAAESPITTRITELEPALVTSTGAKWQVELVRDGEVLHTATLLQMTHKTRRAAAVEAGKMAKGQGSYAPREALGFRGKGQRVHSFRLTDAMRKDIVEKGFPILGAGLAIIDVLRGGDVDDAVSRAMALGLGAVPRGRRQLKLKPKGKVARLKPGVKVEPHKRTAKGEYVGAPGHINVPKSRVGKTAALKRLRKTLHEAHERGVQTAGWYERSAKEIARRFGEDAERFIGLAAILSGNTGVLANMTNALKAWRQFKAGKPIEAAKFPAQDKAANELLYENKGWDGVKTGSFYQNLMHFVDPAKVPDFDPRSVTLDLWMFRKFGYEVKGTEAFDASKYRFAEKEVQRLADELGVEPLEAQERIWGAAKAEGIIAQAERLKLDKPGTKIPTMEEALKAATLDFGKALERQGKAQLPFETEIGKTGAIEYDGVNLSGVHEATAEQSMAVHEMVVDALNKTGAVDKIYSILGLGKPKVSNAPGWFEGRSVPSVQLEVPAPRVHRGSAKQLVQVDQPGNFSAAAAAIGRLLKQDAVAWYRPFFQKEANMGKAKNIGAALDLSSKATPEFVREFTEAVQKAIPGAEIGFVPKADAIHLLHLDFSSLDNSVFWSSFRKYIGSKEFNALLDQHGIAEARNRRFAYEGDYIENDWSVDKNGEGYTRRISEAGRSDLLERLDGDIDPATRPALREAYEAGAKRFGWGDYAKAIGTAASLATLLSLEDDAGDAALAATGVFTGLGRRRTKGVFTRELMARKAAAAKRAKGKPTRIQITEQVYTIPEQIKPPKGAPVARGDVVKFWEGALKVPIRARRFVQRAKSIFKGKEQVIRAKDVHDLNAISGAVGEVVRVNHNLTFPDGVKTKPRLSEMEDLGRAILGDEKPAGTYGDVGFREYMVRWLTGDNPGGAAPKFHDWFEKTFLKENAGLADALNKGQGLTRTWYEQGAYDRGMALLDFGDVGVVRRFASIPLEDQLAYAKRGRQVARNMFFDALAGLEDFEKEARGVRTVTPKTTRPSESPYITATVDHMTAGSKARTWILDGMYDHSGVKVAPPLREILAPIKKKQVREFALYAVARRSLDLAKRDIEGGMPRADAELLSKQLGSETFKKTLGDLTEWQSHVLDYLVEAGGLTKEAQQLMMDLNPVYVPFKRIFDRYEGKGVGARYGSVSSPIKRIRGSLRKIQDPIEAIMAQTIMVIGTADRVRVGRLVAELAAEKGGLGHLVEKVPSPKELHRVSMEDLKSQLESAGADLADADLGQILNVYTNAKSILPRDNIVSFWKDGKREFYQLDKELYRSIMQVDQVFQNQVVQFFMGKPARLLRLGATGLNPEFAGVTNPLRDFTVFGLQTEYASKFFPATWAKGFLIRTGLYKKESLQQFRTSGVDMSMMLGIDRNQLKNVQHAIFANTKTAKALNVLRHPVEALRELLSLTEAGPRLGEFDSAYKFLHDKYGTKADARIGAAFAAADVTINFRRMGQYGKIINSMIPFWNANIQGWSKMSRSLIENKPRALMRGVAGVTAPTLALWWLNKDEQWYKEMPTWQKVLFWNFSVSNNEDGSPKIWRIPRPFEWGLLFGAIPEMLANYHYDNDNKAFMSTMKEMYDAAAPDWVPTTARVPLELYNNVNWFTGRNIVPSYWIDKRPTEEQYFQSTPKTYRALGRMLGVSPLQVHHAVRGVTAGLTTFPEKVVRFVGNDEFIQPAYYPIVGRLFQRSFSPEERVERLEWAAKNEQDRIVQLLRYGYDTQARMDYDRWHKKIPDVGLINYNKLKARGRKLRQKDKKEGKR